MWKRHLWRILMPLVITLLACGVQTVLWPNIFGELTAPPLWLLVITWLSLYRERSSTILLVYAAGWLTSAFTAMPLKMMFTSLLILHLVVTFTRQRIFWSGVSYFVLASVCSVAAFQIIYMALSVFLEPVRAAWLPLERIVQLLLVVPSSFVVYVVMNRFELPHPAEQRAHEGGL
ncbi:MAG: hypothetical protein KF802_14330 [Bdellovibrionaceae bacterium]|nr:hypothetical protein [Pseudobdellovibrionaceae bacterium]MBX3033211.1 hypothetical protein [Pseudobdellovibrionaceae bacterium]